MSATRSGRWSELLCALLVLGALLAPVAVRAEESPIRLTMQKLRGAELLGHIAGAFRLAVEAPSGVRLVTFYVDGKAVGYATSHPFTFRFDTRDFPQGVHELTAVARFANGTATISNSISLDFRPRKWHMAVRVSLFLYAGLLIGLCVLGGLAVHRLLRLRPRLILLNR